MDGFEWDSMVFAGLFGIVYIYVRMCVQYVSICVCESVRVNDAEIQKVAKCELYFVKVLYSTRSYNQKI